MVRSVRTSLEYLEVQGTLAGPHDLEMPVEAKKMKIELSK